MELLALVVEKKAGPRFGLIKKGLVGRLYP